MSLTRATILEATEIPQFWAPWFKDRTTWEAWFVFLKALFCLPMSADEKQRFTACTNRQELPTEPIKEAWLVCGRRAGKSFILALIACYLAVFRDWRPYLSPGEIGTIKIIATDRDQARVIYGYAKALLSEVPVLAEYIVRSDHETIELNNRIRIEIQTASFRTIRGYTIIAALCDEIAFWRSDDHANPDTEILDALRPAMATIPDAMLLCASSPYARRGALWQAFRTHWGEPSPVLLWRAGTRAMNPTIPQQFIDKAYEHDPAVAASEYGAEFRVDIETFIAREAVEALVVPGRYELPPLKGIAYTAFVDPSGGSSDSMTLAIAHHEDECCVLDVIREVRPPFSPESVVTDFAKTLRDYRVYNVTGDRFAGEWVAERFREHAIRYEVADRPKSDLYRDFLPVLSSSRVELLDHPRLITQLCALERRTARGGRDSIDHPPGGHDDVANVVAGVAASRPVPGVVITEQMLAAARLPARRWR